MTAWLLALVPACGLWLRGVCTFQSCVAIPLPASIFLLAAGGFVAARDLPLGRCVLAALAGALLGDRTGFWTGRWGGAPLLDRLGGRVPLLVRARGNLARRGDGAVVLARWLVPEIGPSSTSPRAPPGCRGRDSSSGAS